MPASKKIDPTTIVFSPGEAREAAVEMVRHNRRPENKGIRFGINCLDAPNTLLRLKRSELTAVIGRPRNGKTQLMMNTALVHAQDLEQAGIVERATVVVSWEQSVEAMATYGMARHTGLSLNQIASGEISDSEMQLVEKYPVVRAGEQLFFIGFSDTIQARRPPLTVDIVAQALETIRDWNGIKNSFALDLVVLDYLQRIPYDGRAESKTVGISKNVDAIKDLTLQFACAVILGSQAKQVVETRDDKIPEATDSEYTDNLFQSGDKLLAVMRPALYYEPGKNVAGITLDKKTIEQLMLVRVGKQKMGRSEFTKAFLFDTSYCRYIGDLETREV